MYLKGNMYINYMGNFGEPNYFDVSDGKNM
jgi:hypothetical protein